MQAQPRHATTCCWEVMLLTFTTRKNQVHDAMLAYTNAAKESGGNPAYASIS
jgi:cytochrome c-type biogenesis protein CcmH/NrfG